MKPRYMYGQIYIELFVKPEARRKNAQQTDNEQIVQVAITRDARRNKRSLFAYK
jgi:uncharacterized protein YggU (UPF0235/DUF167 family)